MVAKHAPLADLSLPPAQRCGRAAVAARARSAERSATVCAVLFLKYRLVKSDAFHAWLDQEGVQRAAVAVA